MIEEDIVNKKTKYKKREKFDNGLDPPVKKKMSKDNEDQKSTVVEKNCSPNDDAERSHLGTQRNDDDKSKEEACREYINDEISQKGTCTVYEVDDNVRSNKNDDDLDSVIIEMNDEVRDMMIEDIQTGNKPNNK